MKKIKYLFLSVIFISATVKGQELPIVYKVKPKVDIPIIIGGMGLSYYGYFEKQLKKTGSDTATILALDPNNIAKINRPATKQFLENGSAITDYFFVGIAAPLFLVIDPNVRNQLGTVSLMYLEALSITGMFYTMTVGHVDKYRPYAYNTEKKIVDGVEVDVVPFSKKVRHGAKNSFYGGHPSATAAGMFFFAKVFNDYHPDSKWKYAFWGAATAATLGNVYFRYHAGQHFPTDLGVGVLVGTAIGIGVPYFHKVKNKSVSLNPVIGPYNGAALTYTFNK